MDYECLKCGEVKACESFIEIDEETGKKAFICPRCCYEGKESDFEVVE